MNKENCVILRSQSPVVPTSDNLVPGATITPLSFHQEPETLEIEEAELSTAERHDLRRDPRTRAIAPPMPMKLIQPVKKSATSTTDTGDVTWGVAAVKATQSPFDGSGVTVAVLDTGIDPNHPVFANVDIIQRNFTTEVDNDINGHGTHCAGTIFGGTIDGKRVGIAPNVKRALIGKVLGEGGGSSAIIAQAIQWAVNEGAHVVSMSLGIDFPGYVDFLVNTRGWNINPATSKALEAYRANINLFTELARFVRAQSLFGQGTLIIAASGNESERPNFEIAVSPPAAGTGIIAVGALQKTQNGLKVASFSNNQVDIAAPGVDIISATPSGELAAMSGTSMATPHVAGVAALWAQRQLQVAGEINSQRLLARLIASGTMETLADNAEAEDVGTGIVQAPIE